MRRVIDWIGHLYANLPLVRELQRCSLVAEALHLQQEQFTRDLLAQDRYRDPRCLAHYEHQVYSQNGEDGILAEIFRRIGTAGRRFVEIGVEDGLENNTTLLLAQGWQGWWVEADPRSARRIRREFRSHLAGGALTLLEQFATAENARGLLERAGVTEEIDLLSIDVDQNTYWLWAALGDVRARAAVVEYNAVWPPSIDWKVRYEPRRAWDGSMNYGASLKAFEILGRQLGYHLVGCDLCGVNAFFVREDLSEDLFLEPGDAETHYEPFRHFLIRRRGHFPPAAPQPVERGPGEDRRDFTSSSPRVRRDAPVARRAKREAADVRSNGHGAGFSP